MTTAIEARYIYCKKILGGVAFCFGLVVLFYMGVLVGEQRSYIKIAKMQCLGLVNEKDCLKAKISVYDVKPRDFNTAERELQTTRGR